MLALKQALSLVSLKPLSGWSPSNEGSLVAWYKYNSGISRGVGSVVNSWEDSSSNSYDMEQATEENKPQLNATYNTVDFVSEDVSFLQTSGQITLPGEFTIAFRITATAFNNTIIGDNTTSNEYIKLTSATNIRLTIDGSSVNLDNSGGFGTNNVIITRNSSDDVKMYVDNVLTDTQNLSGTSDIDALGVRSTNINSFDGSIFEVQIYNSTSSALNTNINDRLSNL